MNTQQLFNAIDNADDKYILEILEDEPQKALVLRPVRERPKLWKIALTTAACAALVGGAFYVKEKLAALPPVVDNFAPASGDSAASYIESTDNAEQKGYVIQTDTPSQNGYIMPTDTTPHNTFSVPSNGERHEIERLNVESRFDEFGDAYPIKNPPYYYHSYLHGTGRSEQVIPGEVGEELYAVMDGEVIYADYIDRLDGFTVILKHNDDLYTWYCLLNTEIGVPVNVGDKVKAGQTVGYIGGSVFNYTRTCSVYKCIHSDMWNPSETYYEKRDETISEWLKRPLVYPMQNISKNFRFDNKLPDTENIPGGAVIYPSKKGEPVYAVDDGELSYTFFEGSAYITIEHDNGITTLYKVESIVDDFTYNNRSVKAGDIIGYTSDSGFGYSIDWSIYAFRDAYPEFFN